jgi:hypothetical protein
VRYAQHCRIQCRTRAAGQQGAGAPVSMPLRSVTAVAAACTRRVDLCRPQVLHLASFMAKPWTLSLPWRPDHDEGYLNLPVMRHITSTCSCVWPIIRECVRQYCCCWCCCCCCAVFTGSTPQHCPGDHGAAEATADRAQAHAAAVQRVSVTGKL